MARYLNMDEFYMYDVRNTNLSNHIAGLATLGFLELLTSPERSSAEKTGRRFQQWLNLDGTIRRE
jgi:hypothetical protein